MFERRAMQIQPADDLVVALCDLKQGESVEVNGATIELVENIPAKHQFAVRDVVAGETARMYGVIVGKARALVRRGERFTTQNFAHAAADYNAIASGFQWQPPDVTAWQNATFDGYHRDGFERAFEHAFVIEERVPVEESERTLYLMRRRD